MSDYQEHLDRIMAAVRIEPVDRIPVMQSGSACNAAFCGKTLKEYCDDPVINTDCNLEAAGMWGEVDGTQATCFQPRNMARMWLGRVLMPGHDLPENELWQMAEQEVVSQEDYDIILEEGYQAFYAEIMNRIGNPIDEPEVKAFREYTPTAIARFVEAGIPCFNGGSLFSPIELFTGGRMLINFFADDLFDFPEKVEEAFDIVQKSNLEAWDKMYSSMQNKPAGVWIGGWRGTPDVLNKDMFERFSWKYLEEIFDLVTSHGIVPLWHLDACWDKGLQYFRKLPKGKSILGFDGQTDIFLAAEVLGGHTCIMGDVNATMLSFDTAYEVDAYCKRLIDACGPTGYIMSSGCDAPYNAKLENVQVLCESVRKYGQ